MAFRDDRDALRHKLDATKQELEESERERLGLEDELDDALEALEEATQEREDRPEEPAHEPPSPKPLNSWRVLLIAGVLVTGVLRLITWLVEPDPPRIVIDPGYPPGAAFDDILGDLSIEELGDPGLVPPDVPAVEWSWSLSVTESENPTFPPGAACDLIVTGARPGLRRTATIQCGEHSLFFGTVADGAERAPETSCSLETASGLTALRCDQGGTQIDTGTREITILDSGERVVLELVDR